MQSQIIRFCFTIEVLLFTVSACQQQVQPYATATRPASEQTIIALIQTSTALASNASTPIPPISTQPEIPVNMVTPAMSETAFVPTVQFQPYVEASPTLYIPPTLAVIPTSSVPLAMLAAPTICSEGPGPLYKAFSAGPVGTKYLITGRYSPQNYFIVAMPDGRPCWLPATSVAIEGNTSALPERALPVGSIRGQVLNAFEGFPINDANVEIHPANQAVRTNTNGEYSFSGVPIGDITISVRSPTLSPAFQVVTLREGQTLDQVNFTVYFVLPHFTWATDTPAPTVCPMIFRCVFPRIPEGLPTFQALP